MTQPTIESTPPDDFRWQAFFQKSTAPLFLINHRRRILFVNRAWEELTGFSLKDVRGEVCRRRTAGSTNDRKELVLSSLAPPKEALEGQFAQVRRRLLRPLLEQVSTSIVYVPLSETNKPLAILGKIALLERSPVAPPLPERILNLRDPLRHRLDDFPAFQPISARIVAQARLAAQMRGPVLLNGAKGTGKHWLARAIHEISPLREAFFLKIDAQHISGTDGAELLCDDALHSRLGIGAIYLEEPACLPREVQARLVAWVHAHESNDLGPRLLVGSVSPLSQEVQTGRLLDELRCLVTALQIDVPPLRERRAELPLFLERLLPLASQAVGQSAKRLHPDCLPLLTRCDWPGNLDELYDVLQAATNHAKGDYLEVADLPFYIRETLIAPERTFPLDTLLEQAERRLILLALKIAKGNKSRASELLAIWRPRLLRRMEHLGLSGESDPEHGE